MKNKKTPINNAIDKIKARALQHQYQVRGDHSTYNDYNQGWSDACDLIQQDVETLLPSEKKLIKKADKAQELANKIISRCLATCSREDQISTMDIVIQDIYNEAKKYIK